MGIDNVYGLGGLRPGVTTSSARPGSPYNGQVIYETDTDKIAVYDGSSWVYKTADVYPKAGAILQVVSATLTTTFSASVASAGEAEVTNLSVTITPSSTSSKVLVIANVNKGTYGNFGVKRDSTLIAVGDAAGSRVRSSGGIVGTSGDWGTNQGIHTLDSPSTTSSVTYKVFLRQQLGSTATLYCNRSDFDTDATTAARYASAITAMEVAG